jgi:tetratricopeptide (TPR) repeat protein
MRSGPEWTVTLRSRPSTSTHPPAKDGDRPAVGSLGRFDLLEELGRGGTGVVYEAYDRESHAVVALKTLVSRDAEDVFRLKQEFRTLANLEHENFVRFEELSSADGHLFFTMERVRGADFLRYAREPAHGRAEGFDEARLRGALGQLVDALGALHAAGRIHRDIKPSNVLVTTEGRLVLLDFGLTSGFGRSLPAPEPSSDDESDVGGAPILGTPAYMAPEQLDGAALSPATDWYAVGVMLYAAMTGQLPFPVDPLDMVHAKLSAAALAPIGDSAPEDLRELCLALLRPDPGDRPGVREIRARMGRHDSVEQTEEVFVGRQAELDRLRSAFAQARTATRGLVVRGEPGIGKSALVERFLAELPGDTIVLRGRCYEQENVPFGGIDSLVDALSEYMLGLPGDQLARVLAGGVSHVARVFPVLYRVPIVHAQRVEGPAVHDATLRDHAIHELGAILAALGREQTPVLFIDDLQWVDPDSLVVIRQALLGKGARCLFLGTMRSSGDLAPGLAEFVADLEPVEVAGLSDGEALDVCNALANVPTDVGERVRREAAGHPLFLAELLRSARSGTWVRDDHMRLQDVLWTRIAGRDATERALLEMTALAGAPTPYAVLADAAGLDVGECRGRLAGLRAAQLVRVSRVGAHRCLEPYHDRLREALLEHLAIAEGGELSKRHLRLGRALLAATPEDELEARVFSIVHHMNTGRAYVETREERTRLAELNLLASRKATTVTAFERARRYAETGLECLRGSGAGEEAWSREPSLCGGLHLARMVGEYRTGHRDAALRTFDEARRHVRDPLARSDLYVILIDLDGSASFEGTIQAGREILAELGEPLPLRASMFHVAAEYARTWWSQKTADELLGAPELRDPRTRGALRVLTALAAPAYMSGNTNLFSWMMMRQARITMERGMSEAAPAALVGYGIMLAVVFGRYADAAAYGRLAVELADQDKHARVIANVHYAHGVLVLPWVAGFDRALEHLEKARELAHAYGDSAYECFSLSTVAMIGMAMGRDLDHVSRSAKRALEFASLCRIRGQVEANEVFIRHVAALRGETPGLSDVSLPGSSHATFLASLEQEHGQIWVNLALAELSYLAGDHARAATHLGQVLRHRKAVLGMPPTADIWLLDALVAAGLYPTASVAGRLGHLARVSRAARKLDEFARSCPENFAAHAAIARAELSRIRGRAAQAAEAYDVAIAAARECDAPKRRAVASELACRNASAMGDRERARRYGRMAIDGYQRWGARAKAALVEASVKGA